MQDQLELWGVNFFVAWLLRVLLWFQHCLLNSKKIVNNTLKLIHKTMNWASGLHRFNQSQYKTGCDSQLYPRRYNKCDLYWNEKPFDVGRSCVKVSTRIQLWLQVRGFLIFLIGWKSTYHFHYHLYARVIKWICQYCDDESTSNKLKADKGKIILHKPPLSNIK